MTLTSVKMRSQCSQVPLYRPDQALPLSKW